MRRKHRKHIVISLLLIISDIVMINISLLASYWLRFNSKFIPLIYDIPDVNLYLKPLPIIILVLLLIIRTFGLYSQRRRLSVLDEFFAIIKAMTVGVIIIMSVSFIYREFFYSRVVLFICWINLIFFVFLARFLLNRIRFALRSANKDYSNLLIIGTDVAAKDLIQHIKNDLHWNYRIVGLLNVPGSLPKQEVLGINVIGELNELSRIIDENDIEEVIISASSIPRDDIISIIMECEKKMVTFRLIADTLGMITSNVDMENIDGVPLIGLKETPLANGYNRVIKRIIDIAGSLFGLIIFSPLFFILSIVIKLSSQGPVFYTQERVGEDGKVFLILKFRTMMKDAEKDTGPVWAKEQDARRTKIGALLRKHNLDELPQLLNVLKGEMSLVGPRPERPQFVGKFKESIPRYMARHKIRSGMSGWAQVNGLRGNTSIEERTRYDLYYIENWSIFFDIKIVLMTIFQMIFSDSKNAY